MDKIAIIGLGLIGGSFAKALRQRFPKSYILGIDLDAGTCRQALEQGVIDSTDIAELPGMRGCMLCLYPQTTVDFCRVNADLFVPGQIVMDACGVKRRIVETLEPFFARRGVAYIGCHPMAGREVSGYANALPDLFMGHSFLIARTAHTTESTADFAAEFAVRSGFSRVVFTTPEEHDRVIALTSQLAHIVSSAYIKSPTAQKQDGFTGGSFQDMTRVARMNDNMWPELFLSNREYLLTELRGLIAELQRYEDALTAADAEELRCLMQEGTARRLEIGT
ncbi:MAG: prephenate dehydrogenase [Oscillospiraceae bacterium]|nr:prephenate dehydrogenase [Oscillospiraceae bacterium]